MKKAALLLAALLLLLPGCSKVQGNGRVTPVKLTKHEQLIATAASETTLVFDYEAGKNCKWITFSLDEYKFGEKATGGGQLSFGNELGAGKGTFIISLSRSDTYGDGPQHCTLLATSSGSSYTFPLTDVPVPGQMARSFNATPAGAMPESGSMALATLIYTSSSWLEASAINPDTTVDSSKLKDYDAAYILTCTFSEEQPTPSK